jgi:acyl dehydratase
VPVDPSYAGRTYPPTEPYRVGREKIREFADAIGAMDAAYRDPEAARALGHPDVVAPPTFPVLLTLAAGRAMIDDPALGIDYARVVHGDQRFEYARPVVAGDVLTCVCTIQEVLSRGGNDFLTTRTEVTDASGALVVTAWTKLVHRGE